MNGRNGFNILGIESSCDDTGVAIISNNGRVLSNCVNSQLKRHVDFGGIIPVLAKEYHLDNIDNVAKQAFRESKLNSVKDDIHAIAVTTRPGLQFSLQIGLNYARKLAQKYSKPLIPIHHMQAHSLMPLLTHKNIRFPYLTLLLSGGHCLLAIVKRFNDFNILGGTLDEAPGEFLDKFARRYKLKNLGPPFDSISGGGAIELLAARPGADRFKYFASRKPIPMTRTRSCDFSFSGYRGAFDLLDPIINELWCLGKRDKLIEELSHACASLQRILLIQIVKKLQRAFFFYRMHWRYENEDAFKRKNCPSNPEHIYFDVRNIDDSVDIVISGGVAANSYLIDGIRLACNEFSDSEAQVFSPSKELCGDNGLMIAWNGLLHYENSRNKYNTKDDSGDAAQSIITDSKEMDAVEVANQCPIGLDISDRVKGANFVVSKLNHPEFKTVNASDCSSS